MGDMGGMKGDGGGYFFTFSHFSFPISQQLGEEEVLDGGRALTKKTHLNVELGELRSRNVFC